MSEVRRRSRASPRLAADDSRGDQVSDAKRFWQHAADRGDGKRFLDHRLLCTDIRHPERSVPGADGLQLVPTNDRESFLPVVETAAHAVSIESRFGFFRVTVMTGR